jgi:hypothetical protein
MQPAIGPGGAPLGANQNGVSSYLKKGSPLDMLLGRPGLVGPTLRGGDLEGLATDQSLLRYLSSGSAPR